MRISLRSPGSRPEAGFVLIVVLALLALTLITVVSFLATAQLERRTSRAYATSAQAQFAVESGFEAAKWALTRADPNGVPITQNDHFIVVKTPKDAPNGQATYQYIGIAQDGGSSGTGSVTYYPLFSGGQEQVISNLTQLPPPPTGGATGQSYPKVYPWMGAPNSSFIPLESSAVAPATPQVKIRYSYWIEDLGGYVDPKVAGQPAGGNRSTGTNPKEIGLFTLFDEKAPIDAGDPTTAALLADRPLLLSVPTTLALLNASGPIADAVKFGLAPGLVDDNEQQIIPFGFGYRDAGKPKIDINVQVTAGNGGVQPISDAITGNLPNFTQRKGGLTSLDYTKTIAASIIDYADTDSKPTIGSDYRGIDSYPFVKEVYDQYNWSATSQVGGNFVITIEVTTFVEIWNPSNVVVPAEAVTFKNVHNTRVTVNGSTNPLPPETLAPSPTMVAMQANEYQLLTFAKKTYQFPWGPTPPAGNATILVGSSNSTFEFNYGGIVVDKPFAGVSRQSFSLSRSSGAKWRGNASPPIFASQGMPGDPRANYYLGKQWSPANYDTNSAWGGHARIPSVTPPAETLFSKWPDSGHDDLAGFNPTGVSQDPKAIYAAHGSAINKNPTKAPARLSNTGFFKSITELGAVYDPAQWVFDATTFDIPTTASANAAAGGGFTLRIGRPEFTKFNVDGQRAWQLLDLFSVGTRKLTAGTVNLNTASRDALRALAAGVVGSDSDVKPTNLANKLYPPRSSASAPQADAFADAVIASRPFISTAQLSAIQNANGPYFGNRAQWQDGNPPTELNDWGYEELFSKLYNFAAVRSRNFRIFVSGQVLDKKGKPIASANRVYHVFLSPARDAATGAIQAQTVRILYESSL